MLSLWGLAFVLEKASERVGWPALAVLTDLYLQANVVAVMLML